MCCRAGTLLLCLMCFVAGCDSGRYERTLSVLNIEADRWPGGNNFATTVTDAYGNPLSVQIEKGPVHYVLEVRSNGADGLPKNSDDIVVTRREKHGESTMSDEAQKVVEKMSSGATKGAVKGIKEGLGFGGKKE